MGKRILVTMMSVIMMCSLWMVHTPEVNAAAGVARTAHTLLAGYDFADENVSGPTIRDISGNGYNATLSGTGGVIQNGELTLPGGAAGSSAAYVTLPGNLFVGQDTLTISIWLKNQTGSGNYSGMFFGTPTSHIGGGTANMPLNYWLLNPANPSGYFKSVWTNSNSASAPYNTETPTSTTTTGSDWAMYTTVITPNSIKGYYNGQEVCSNAKTKTTTDFGSNLVAYIGRSAYNDMFYKGGVRDVQIYAEEFSAADVLNEYHRVALESDKKALVIPNANAVRSDLTLPTQGTSGSSITWTSDTPTVITDDGKVTRQANDVTVTMTAALTLGSVTLEKEFEVTVLGGDANTIFHDWVDDYEFEYNGYAIIDDMTLPTIAGTIAGADVSITWSSSNPAVLSDSGLVTRPASGEEDAVITLTASFAYNDGETVLLETREFKVTVRSEVYGYLMAYTTNSQTETAALGKSLHLAYSEDGKNYTALNSNTGICFAGNVGGSKNVNPNGLQNMQIFRKKDGTYGMIARNIVANQQYVYLYDSVDLVNFTNERRLALGSNVTIAPKCVYDKAEDLYKVYWGSSSRTYVSTTQDLKTVIATTQTSYTPDTVASEGTWPTGAESGNSVFGVSKTEYNLVVNKLGVVKNTGMKPVEIVAYRDTDLNSALPATVTAEYNDGSTRDMKVTWNAAELAGVDLNTPGTYEVTGTVLQTEYDNPFITQRADPCILKGPDGYYYFTASYPMLGSSDRNGYDKIVLRRAQTIEGLRTATEVTIWDCDNSPNQHRYIWAPEILYINGSYYVYYTASVESNSVWGIRPHVLKCNNPEDIMNPASWEEKGRFQAVATDGQAFSGFSLDMTYFENNGRHYAIWAQSVGFSSLLMAEIDPNEPWKCISDSIIIAKPEYAWERQVENVDEGASVIKKDGKIYVAFSAAGTGPEYCVGLLSADEDADLLDVNSWTKQGYPVLTSSDVPGEYGPGHNSFTVDEDGNPIFVYHARGEACYRNQCSWGSQDSLYDPCRDARLKRVHWAADGTPILKMSYAEELAAENKTVTAVITVGAEEPDVPTLYGHSLTLDGTIGVNWYVYLPEAYRNTGTKMIFTYRGKQYEVPFNAGAKQDTKEGYTVYRFTHSVPAKEMTEEIRAQLVCDAGNLLPEEDIYTIKNYADTMLNEEAVDGNAYAFAKALLNYGGYAQSYFKYNLSNLANKDIEKLPNIEASALADFNTSYGPADVTNEATWYGSSLILESQTTIRHYVTITNEEVAKKAYMEYAGEKIKLTPHPTQKNIYYADIENIAAPDLKEKYVAQIYKEGEIAISNTKTYGAYTYVYNTLMKSTDISLKNLVKAMYGYAEATDSYLINNKK